MKLSLTLAVALALLMPSNALAKVVPADDHFFAPPPELLHGKPGSLVWYRKAPASPPGLPYAAKSYQLIYRSRSASGKPVFVSGMLDLPYGRPPRGGWPLISWGHATTGTADRCAPSRNRIAGPKGFIFNYTDLLFKSWLAKGFALARTDYQGLGTPGPHLYLVGEPAGRSLIDMVSASRQLNSHLSRSFLLAGHSQGGHAVLFAAQGARRWAPGLHLSGVLAAAPGSYVEEQESLEGLTKRPQAITGFAWLIWIAAALEAGQDPRSVLKSPGYVKSMVESSCIVNLVRSARRSGLPARASFKAGEDYPAILQVMRRMHPSIRTDAPITLLQGGLDPMVAPEFSERLYRELKANGNRAELVSDPVADHTEILTRQAGLAYASRWPVFYSPASGSWGSWGESPGPLPGWAWRIHLP